jgi:uncharacterized protein (UPF0264 family)
MDYALSVKQPWAALLVHGRKTIEIRRWSTARRGRVLIHAARIPDDRPEAWAHVTADVEATARLRGGVIGEAQLSQCNTYRSRSNFERDQAAHLNDPDWFRGPVMYGFVFVKARPLPYTRCPGSLHFFEVSGPVAPAIPKTTSQLLVSVRSAKEALAAFDGGADLIDIKEPGNGPLGRAPAPVVSDVVRRIAGRRSVSVALGELVDLPELPAVPGLGYVKCGLSNLGDNQHWDRMLKDLHNRVARLPQPPEVVTVAYADWNLARSPAWPEVAQFALRKGGGTLLVDTFDKRWRPVGTARRVATLLDWLSLDEIGRLCDDCRAAGVKIALAGSLRIGHIAKLLDLRPTWFAVRGAVCAANDRDGAVHPLKVCSLTEWLRFQQKETTSES